MRVQKHSDHMTALTIRRELLIIRRRHFENAFRGPNKGRYKEMRGILKNIRRLDREINICNKKILEITDICMRKGKSFIGDYSARHNVENEI